MSAQVRRWPSPKGSEWLARGHRHPAGCGKLTDALRHELSIAFRFGLSGLAALFVGAGGQGHRGHLRRQYPPA